MENITIEGVKQMLESTDKQDQLLSVISLKAIFPERIFNDHQLDKLSHMLIKFCGEFTVDRHYTYTDSFGNEQTGRNAYFPFVGVCKKLTKSYVKNKISKKASKMSVGSRVKYILGHIYARYIDMIYNPEEFKL